VTSHDFDMFTNFCNYWQTYNTYTGNLQQCHPYRQQLATEEKTIKKC